MKNLLKVTGIFFLITCCILYAQCSFAQGTWTSKTSIPGITTRSTAVTFTIGAKGYMGTGIQENTGTSLSDFWEYDPIADTWTQKANFAGGLRNGAVGFSIGTKGYVGTGVNAAVTFKTDFWQYDPATNLWTQKANFGGGPRALAVGFSVDSSGYIGTGLDNLFDVNQDMWKYNPSSNTWTQMNNFGGQIRSDIDRSVFVIGNNAYLGTGLDENSNPLNDFWIYNSLNDTWTQTANVPGLARLGGMGFSICGKGFIGLGYNGATDFYSDMWMFDPGTNSWSAATSFPSSPRDDQPSFVINDTAYIGTGEVGVNTTINDLWAYTLCSAVVPPVALFQSSDTAFCSGDCINYTDLGSNATSWLWNFPGGTPSSSTAENPSVCYLASGNFNVTFIAFNSGASDTLKVTNLINVFPSPPTPNITKSNDTLYCSTDPSYISYQWYDSSAIIPGATNTFYVAVNGGNYNVQVSNQNGCQIAVGINVILGIEQLVDHGFPFRISPNPVADILILNGESKLEIGNWKFSIFNMQGGKVLSFSSAWQKSTDAIDVKTLPAGIYFLKAANEKEEWIGKFVKE